MLDLIWDITKVYLSVVGMLLLVELFSFLLANWPLVLLAGAILCLALLLLPVVIVVKVVKWVRR